MTIWFVVDFFSKKTTVTDARYYGWPIVILVFIMEGIVLFTGEEIIATSPFVILWGELLLLGRVYVTVFVGMYYARDLGLTPFQLKNWRENLKIKSLYIVITSILFVLYSYILFAVTNPKLSETVQRLVDMDPNIVVEMDPTFTSWIFVLQAAVLEEVTYRLGMQNFLASKFEFFRKNYWGAIIISSLLWSFGHANTIDPEWVKFAQIFPFGLALGYTFRKYGIEACILIHALFNVLMLLFGPGL